MQGNTVRIMSYNLLADAYAHDHATHLYSAVKRPILDWRFRAPRIVEEVCHWEPDVVCMQEVDHYDDLEAPLRRHGYDGIYIQRTGGRPDGLAMFWRRSRCKLKLNNSIEFSELGYKDNVCQIATLDFKNEGRSRKECSQSSTKDPIKDDRMTKSSQVCEYEGQPTYSFVVANIHVLFNPKRGDIKLAQVRTMLQQAAADANKGSNGCAMPIFVCGDFNSAVGSPLYNFVVDGELDLLSTDTRRMSGQIEVSRKSRGSEISRWSPTPFDNIANSTQYAAVSISRTELEVTNRTLTLNGPTGSIAQSSSFFSGHQELKYQEASQSDHTSVASSESSCTTIVANKSVRPWTVDEINSAMGTNMDLQTDEELRDVSSLIVRHPLQLESTYYAVNGEEPFYTTAHDKYVGTVDYIFFTPSSSRKNENEKKNLPRAGVRPVRIVMPPPLSSVPKGLPSSIWPSDHISLVADFEFLNASV